MPSKPKSTASSKKPLSRDRILKAAIRLADKKGIETLSMRKLAQVLGVEAMSLYNHVTNKEDALDGMVDIVISKIEVPVPGSDWKTAMRQRANSAHTVLLRHPWASMLILSRVNVGEASLRYVDATVGCLVGAGFSYEMADRAWNAVDSHIYGFTLQELNFPFKQDEYADVAADFMHMIPVNQYPYLHNMAQQVIDGSHDGIQDFEFGLELVLEGLERLLAGDN